MDGITKSRLIDGLIYYKNDHISLEETLKGYENILEEYYAPTIRNKAIDDAIRVVKEHDKENMIEVLPVLISRLKQLKEKK